MSRSAKKLNLVLSLIAVILLCNRCTKSAQPPTDTATVNSEAISTPFEPLSKSATDCTYGGKIKSIAALDEFTVRFELCSPDAAFLAKIASPALGIQSANHLQASNGSPLESVLGTGPYMLQEWRKGEQLELIANPNYWGEPPATKRLVFTWNPEAAARLLSLRAGVVDGIDNPDPADYVQIESDLDLSLYRRSPFNIFYIGIPNTKPPLNNIKVRQALARAIDREAIVEYFLPPGSTVADYLAPCEVPSGCVGQEWPDYDPEGARQLLSEADFPDGFELKLSYRDVTRPYLPSPSHIAIEIQSQLSKIGVDVILDVQESSTFVANSVEGNLGMHLLGWTGRYLDQTSFVDVFFGKDADQSLGDHWPEVEDLIAQAGAMAEQTQRESLYKRVNNLVREYVPLIPVGHVASAIATSESVEGLRPSMVALEEFQYASVIGKDILIWQQNLEPSSLYCADASDGDAMRLCAQMFDSLMAYGPDGTSIGPGLATSCTVSDEGYTWICHLQNRVKFSDGTPLTANDVVATFVVQWDASDPLHVGSNGLFYDWQVFFGPFLNSQTE